MRLDGFFYNVELDTGEQSYAQVNRRQKRYAGSTDFLLYVTQSERRLAGLRKSVDPTVRTIALFTTLDQVLRNPRGPIYVDWFNERTSIVDLNATAEVAETVEKRVEKPVD